MGKWTLPQAEQTEFVGIKEAGINHFNQLCLEAKAGRTAHGLAVEKLFLDKHRADRGIQAPTFKQEKARRHCRGGQRAVAVAPPIDAEAVQGRFVD